MSNLSLLINMGSFIGIYLIFLVLAKFLYEWVTPYSLDKELTTKDNPALGLAVAGYYAAVTAIFVGAVSGPSQTLFDDILLVSVYTALGLVLLHIAAWVNDKVLLYQFCNKKEIIEDRNSGTGVVQAASYLVSGLIIGAAVHGESGHLGTVIAFFAAGQLVLCVFGWLFNWITPFDIHKEIEADNVAAGVSFAGAIVALGIILMRGIVGPFMSWTLNFEIFFSTALVGVVSLVVIRFFTDKVMIIGADLNKEISSDRNLAAAFIEAVCAISFAMLFIELI